MITDSRIQLLFTLYLSGSATPEETNEFLQIVNDPQHQDILHQLMDNYLEETTFTRGLDTDQKTGILNQIFNNPESSSAPVSVAAPVPVIALWKKMLGVAVVLMVLSAAVYFMRTLQQEAPVRYTTFKGEIKPGGNKATLILADGRKVSLTDAADGKVAEEGNVRIRKSAEGRIVYEVISQENELPQYHTIATPAGGQYEVLLPDGTHVWLNAASSLKYPVSFVALKERRVELSGEAYFEVSKISRAGALLPFVVQSEGQQVEVLGTHFNINTYKEEKAAVTTLLEGSVRVSRPGAFAAVLAPGEQAIVDERIRLSKADTSTAVAWKNGTFKFDDADIHTVMNQFSRWYDLDVEYLGKAPGNKFNGEVYRNMDASKAFSLLRLARIKFRLETPLNQKGRKKIVITQQ